MIFAINEIFETIQGEAKYTGKLSVVNPTTGCGGTNCATSVLNAYQDGVPVLFLSGNVKLLVLLVALKELSLV